MGKIYVLSYSVTKNLGFIFDNNIDFKSHISKFIKKSFISLQLIHANCRTLTNELKIVLCNTLILSNFNLCDVLCGSCIYNVVKNFNFCDVLCGSCIYNVVKNCFKRSPNFCLQLIFDIRRVERVSHCSRWMGWVLICN